MKIKKSKDMKYPKFIISILLTLSGMFAYTQPANWVQPTGYQYSMGLNAVVQSSFGNCFVDNPQSLVGAFKNGVCRGFNTYPGFTTSNGFQYLVSFVSNQTFESDIEIQIWDASTGFVYVLDTVDFQVNGNIGSLGAPVFYNVPKPCWNATQLSDSMLIHARVRYAGSNFITHSQSILAAFKNGECRGMAIIGPGLGPDGIQFEMTVYSDSINESGFDLKVLDGETNIIEDINEMFDFSSGSVIGAEIVPEIYTIGVISTPPVIDSIIYSNYNGYNISCFGGNDGTIDLVVNQGTPPYQFLWSNQTTTSSQSGLTSGNYSVTVTDYVGLSTFASIILTQPPALNVASIPTDVLCHGENTGAINLVVSGGILPYSFVWSNNSTTEDLSNILAGNYSVTVSDLNNCQSVQNQSVYEPMAALSVASSHVDVSDCFGDSTGSIDLVISGGTSPYSFVWTNGESSEDLTNIPAGNYVVTVTDFNSCFSIVNENILQPDEITVVSIPSHLNCFNDFSGIIDLTVSGGVSPYSFLWSNGSTEEDLNGIAAGNYMVEITDANNCSIDLVELITQPDSLELSSVLNHVSLIGGNDGSIDLTITGGTNPYSYIWSNMATTEDINSLNAAVYNVTVSDFNNCELLSSFEIEEPPAIMINLTSTDVNCFAGQDGAINLSVSGGTSPYQYSWSNGSLGQNLINIPAGTYSVTVTDSDGNQEVGSTIVSQPLQLSLIVQQSISASCDNTDDGYIDVLAVGGTAPYTYDIDGSGNFTVSNSFPNLYSGYHLLEVMDANNCHASINAELSSVYHTPIIIFDYAVAGGIVQFINFTDTGNIDSWHWDFDDGQMDSVTFEPQHEYNTNGIYYPSFTATNTCGTRSMNVPVEIRAAGIFDIGSDYLSIYPNPTNGNLFVKTESLNQFSNVEVFDLSGKLVYTYQNFEISPLSNLIDISHLDKGVYMLKISSESFVLSSKIIVQN